MMSYIKHFFSLKSNKSPGYDYISSNVVKAVFYEVFSTIKHLFDISLQQGVFPGKLKIVCPIFKNGDKSSLPNYRPISVLS